MPLAYLRGNASPTKFAFLLRVGLVVYSYLLSCRYVLELQLHVKRSALRLPDYRGLYDYRELSFTVLGTLGFSTCLDVFVICSLALEFWLAVLVRAGATDMRLPIQVVFCIA